MRPLLAALLAFALTSAHARIPPPGTWKTTNAHEGYVATGQGDPWSEAGADVSVRSQRDAAGKIGGAISAVAAAPLHQRRVVMSARVSADAGSVGAAIWLRADGPNGRLVFVTSGTQPVDGGKPPAAREISLVVPPQATQLVYGLVFNGNGAARAEAVKLRAEDAPAPAQSDSAQTNVSAAQVLEAALRIVRENALKAGTIDWNSVPPRLRAGIDPNGPAQDAHATVRLLLKQLDDGHSFLLDAGAAEQHQRSGTATEPARVDVLDAGLGYVLMPGFSGRGEEAMRQFSAIISRDIARLAPQVKQGWIVDLRHNSGGNMWPMLAALRPLLGADTPGSSRRRDGEEKPWQLAPDPNANLPDLRNARVAVLIGTATSSAGEAVATAFRGRPGTRFFGAPSDGRATMNSSYPLPDGSLLQLTTAWMVDRTGSVVSGALQPDEFTGLASSGSDPTVEAAKAWLSRKP